MMEPKSTMNGHEAHPAPGSYPISKWYSSRTKRTFDLVGAICLFVVFLPIMVLVAIGVKLTSPGPVIFRQRRPGKLGWQFNILKFRTMVDDRGNPGPAVTRARDPRVTRFGRHMRKWKLDELPQLWNVIVGDMSFVGPRPLPIPHWKEPSIQKEAPYVLSVRPGLTSEATVNFRNEEEMLTPASVAEVERIYMKSIMPVKVKMDLDYLQRASFSSDLVIIFKTGLKIFQRDSVQHTGIDVRLPGAEPRRVRDASVGEFRPVVEKEDYSGVAEQTD